MRHLRFLEAMAGACLLAAILTAALGACSDDPNEPGDTGGDTGANDTGADGAGDIGLDLNPDASPDTAVDGDAAGDPSVDSALDPGTDFSDAGPCDATFTSNLEGVRIRIDDGRCRWTLAEAAAGITFAYTIEVDENVADVRPRRQDAGSCGMPDDSGLIAFASVAGGDERYCICDVGLCEGSPLPLGTLEAGTFARTFEWDGRNFDGPSDTGNEPGDPFPAGVYTFGVRAIGERGAGGDPTPFEIEATLEITLRP